MKSNKQHIIKAVKLVALGSTVVAALVAGPLAGDAPGQDALSIGPGRVSFDVGPGGRWVSFVPHWTNGEPVISGGGFVVMAIDGDGSVVELANTAGPPARLRPGVAVSGPNTKYEGVPGGRRFPLAESDDDGDGMEDEDRLDGVDNDGDGKVDEDFAAAGDQMVALSYDALDGAGRPVLGFHQTNYAWSLPHIDGMVAIRLTVRNLDDRRLEGVRIGAIIPLGGPGESSVSTRDLAQLGGVGERLVSKGIILRESGKRSVAVVLCAEPANANGSWVTGLTSHGRPLVDRVQAVVEAEGHAGDHERDGRNATVGPTRPQPAADRGRIAFGISPDLGGIEPGEEVTVYAALVALPEPNSFDETIESAYRTVVGDGTHPMIPPPVSLKRRTVWGTYKVAYAEGAAGEPSGAIITLENARGQGILAGDLTHLSGIDVGRLEVEELFNGDLQLTLDGELYGEIADAGKRLGLKGRLKNGDFVDLKLNPAEDGRRVNTVEGVSEAQFWSRPGQLEVDLITGSPNPFREQTTIHYEVPSDVSDDEGNVLSFVNPVKTSVKIYNVAGRLVSILVDTVLTPGKYNTSWRAVDENGNNVASGVYYVKLQIGKKHVTKRLIQLK